MIYKIVAAILLYIAILIHTTKTYNLSILITTYTMVYLVMVVIGLLFVIGVVLTDSSIVKLKFAGKYLKTKSNYGILDTLIVHLVGLAIPAVLLAASERDIEVSLVLIVISGINMTIDKIAEFILWDCKDRFGEERIMAQL